LFDANIYSRAYRSIMSDGLSITRLASFLEVVDRGGFAAAAPGNPVRQSQLSRQVADLEAHFGRPLVERRGRGIVITPAGRELAAVARALHNGLADVRAAGADAPMPYSFGAGDSLLHWLVVPRIASVTADVPRAVATLTSLASVDVARGLVDARLDFGLVRADEVPTGLASRPLGTLRHALFVPRVLHTKTREDDLAALVTALPLALQQSEPSLNARFFAQLGVRSPPAPALACETFPQACTAVRTGRYAALLPTIARVDLGPRDVVEVPLPHPGRLAAKLHLAWHPRTTARNAAFARLATSLERHLRLEQLPKPGSTR
jgi:DNA-binding transcriptional LysR family regulator